MILDANVRLGRRGGSRGPTFSSTEDLLAAMDRFGIDVALGYGALAAECDNEGGNRLLCDRVRGHDRIVPCHVLTPGQADPSSAIAEMDANNVPAARLFPRTGHFSVKPWCMAPLAGALEKAGKVLLVDFEPSHWTDEAIDWEGILHLCKAFPALPVIVCGVDVADPPRFRTLLPQCSNLYLEIGCLAVPGEIRRLAELGFSSQLVFGSQLPDRHIGAPLNMLLADTLPEETLTAILGGTMARLLNIDTGRTPVPERKAPAGLVIVDTHLHLGAWDRSATGSGRAGDIVREMDRCGVTAGIATSLWACFGEVALGNQSVAEACAAFPGRLFGYLTLDPKHPAEIADEFARHGDNPHFVGIKIHSGTHGVSITDARCRPILDEANRRHWPVLVHGGTDRSGWRTLCGRYPDAVFIVAHIGGAGPDSDGARDVAGLCRELPNLYIDIAASKSHYGFLSELVKLAGADKILFGSDHPLFDFAYELGQVFYSTLPSKIRTAILSGNARGLFATTDGPTCR